MENKMDIKELLAFIIYKNDYIYPLLKDTVQCVLLDILFSRTILEGKPSVKISYQDLSLLSGCSPGTVKSALKELILSGLVKVVGSHHSRIANEYALNIRIPKNIKQFMPLQRLPYKTVNQIISGNNNKNPVFKLNSEGMAIVNAIKANMSPHEKALYEKKAVDELIIESVEITEEAIDNKITEIIVRGFSNEKRKKYLIFTEQ